MATTAAQKAERFEMELAKARKRSKARHLAAREAAKAAKKPPKAVPPKAAKKPPKAVPPAAGKASGRSLFAANKARTAKALEVRTAKFNSVEAREARELKSIARANRKAEERAIGFIERAEERAATLIERAEAEGAELIKRAREKAAHAITCAQNERDSRLRAGGIPGAFSTWPLRRCGVCGEDKNPASDFYRSHRTGNAYHTCSACRRKAKLERERVARAEGRRKPKTAAELTPEQLARRRERQREYKRNRMQEDPKYRIKHRMSRQIWQHLKGEKGRKSLTSLLPYTMSELKEHLEAQFVDGMSWDNAPAWHIDHIRPVASFDFDSTDHPDFLKCWALDNLQPLWAADNIKKRDRYEP